MQNTNSEDEKRFHRLWIKIEKQKKTVLFLGIISTLNIIAISISIVEWNMIAAHLRFEKNNAHHNS